MRSRYQIIENNSIYFITSTIVEWIPVFTKSAKNYLYDEGCIEIDLIDI